VQLPPPKKGKTSAKTREQAERDFKQGQAHPRRKSSSKRSRATSAALKREGRGAASSTALSRQARQAARTHRTR
jgi:hypothetical protein